MLLVVSAKTGILLVNLGTPESADPQAVGRYLSEFLMDPWVMDIPLPFRYLLVRGLIVPKRSVASAELYSKVWDREHGSPLLYYSREFENRLQLELGSSYEVGLAMRYGNPSVTSVLSAWKSKGLDHIVLLPLYPQYSTAATKSSLEWASQELERVLPEVSFDVISEFYSDPGFLKAWEEVGKASLKNFDYDLLVFSFHGLPARQLKKLRPCGQVCLSSQSCCDAITDLNANCYRAQCFATARSIASRLGVDPEGYRVAFQSRMSGTPWIRPYTDELYETLAQEGIKKIAVFCPSFVADCLETLEEVAIRGKKQFLDCGGEELRLIPSLNTHPAWVDAVAQMVIGRVGRQIPGAPQSLHPIQ